jgi:FAD/FMN-containing dehydrogenase
VPRDDDEIPRWAADDFGHHTHLRPAGVPRPTSVADIQQVLTDYLELSVGGTLSAGGIGGATHRHGRQVDHVRSLEVLTPDGRIVIRGPGDELFDRVRGGAGRPGIIPRATLPLVPAPTHAVFMAALLKVPRDEPTRQAMLAANASSARRARAIGGTLYQDSPTAEGGTP